jgi:hypothetical protein
MGVDIFLKKACAKIPLTHKFSFLYIQLSPKRVLINLRIEGSPTGGYSPNERDHLPRSGNGAVGNEALPPKPNPDQPRGLGADRKASVSTPSKTEFFNNLLCLKKT